MSTNTPVSIWAPYTLQGEFSASDEPLTTQAGVELTTQAGVTITTEETTFTPLAATTWVENDGV